MQQMNRTTISAGPLCLILRTAAVLLTHHFKLLAERTKESQKKTGISIQTTLPFVCCKHGNKITFYRIKATTQRMWQRMIQVFSSLIVSI